MVLPDYEIPKEENTYDFSSALDGLKSGKSIARTGWHGKGMYLNLQKVTPESKMTLPYIYMVIPNQDENIIEPNNLVPWIASQTDLLSNDWIIF